MQINKINVSSPISYKQTMNDDKMSNYPVAPYENAHLDSMSAGKKNKNTGRALRGAVLAGLLGGTALSAASCGSNNNAPQVTPPVTMPETQVQEDFNNDQAPQDELNSLGAEIDAQMSMSGKTQLVEVGSVSMPVTEFYFTNSDGEVVLKPNADIPTNDAGSVIVTITENPSNDKTEGNSLNEIIEKVYSESLKGYEGEARETIKNKMIDEIVQSNPSLADYIKAELGESAKSYDIIGGIDLYKGVTSEDETLDTRMLIMPSVVVYQVQGDEPDNVRYFTSSDTYAPSFESASVVKDEKETLLENDYRSFSDLVYGAYGKDISEEAYRDIVYAIVNAPANKAEFENVIDDMNFYEILETGNINDLNRTLDENTDDIMVGLYLPTVSTLRVQAHNADINTKSTDGIIYQISPGEVVAGQNDRAIAIVDNTNPDGGMKAGDVFVLKDVLQFYSSPDGSGRFANVVNGKLVLNDEANYGEQFAENILKQVAYANMNIFASKYEDQNGVHNYGIFDVDLDYDTTGKSIEDILSHSTVNVDRLMNYQFVDKDGVSRFNEGVELKLPQFTYKINDCDTLKACGCSDDDECKCKPSVPACSCPEDQNPEDPGCNCPDDKPTVPDEDVEIVPDEPDEPSIPDEPDEPSTPDKPTQPTTPTDTHPTTPTDTHPTTPTDTEPTTPTDTEPTTPTDTEPTTPTDTEPTTPTDTEPTTPTDTEPTTPTDTEPTTPTDTEPTTPTDTEPTEPTIDEPDPTIPTDGPTDPIDPDPTDPTDDEPTIPSATDIEPEEPTDTEPTTPTETEPTTPTETEPTTPTETEPTTPTETEPTTPTETEPTTPTETEPTTPTETEPTTPTDTQPTLPTATDIEPEEPTDTDPTAPSEDEPTVPSEPDEPTVPSEPTGPSEPDEPTNTSPSTPSDTDPSCPDEPTEPTDDEDEPGLPGDPTGTDNPGIDEPEPTSTTVPAPSDEPADPTGPDEPTNTAPSTPSDTDPSCPDEPTEPTDDEDEPGLPGDPTGDEEPGIGDNDPIDDDMPTADPTADNEPSQAPSCPDEPTEPTDDEEEPGLPGFNSISSPEVSSENKVDTASTVSSPNTLETQKPKSTVGKLGSLLIEKLAVKKPKKSGINYRA